MKLVQRCKDFAHNVRKIRNGEYRYSFSQEFLGPRPSSITKPKPAKPMTKKEKLEFQNEINKQEARQDEVIRNNADMEPVLLASMIPVVIDPKWEPGETVRGARNAALLDYNKHKSPPLTPEDFAFSHDADDEGDDNDPIELAKENYAFSQVEEYLKSHFDFKDEFDYHDDGYFWGRPIYNFIVIDVLKLVEQPKPVRYWAADWMDYGAYHYPKRLDFDTKEEKQLYRQIHDWTMPIVNINSMFLPNGRLNFDYQPPPWELPVPFALGLPHLDVKVKGFRMFDVYKMLGFANHEEPEKTRRVVNLLDVHRMFEDVWERNVALSPYIAQMAVNARVRAEYNLFGPKAEDEIAWSDFSYHLKRFFKLFISLFISNEKYYSFTPARNQKKRRRR